REVGGLSNQLAAHMELDNPAHQKLVREFWDSPAIPEKAGYKAVDLFDAVHAGEVKAVWIMATNPVVSLPNADRVAEALQRCEHVIVSDAMSNTDTMAYANIKLPACTWGERDGTVTNSERRISRQRPFLPAAGNSMPDWWIISAVAHKMGFENHFQYSNSADIFMEHAALSGYQNNGDRLFDISAFAALGKKGYGTLQPTQWPLTASLDSKPFNSADFSTSDHKAQLIPVTPRPPMSKVNASMPFILNTGRVRDHWHTMTRTALSPRLSSHRFEPFVEIHPHDATTQSLQDGDLAEVFNHDGSVIVRVQVTDKQGAGSLFVPMHWTNEFSASGRVGALVAPNTDPISGQPESKHSVAAIRPYKTKWQGFILTRRDSLPLDYASYWTRSRGSEMWRYEIAGHDQPNDWAQRARSLLCKDENDVNWIEYFDRGTNQYRAARFEGNKLESCVFIGEQKTLPPRDWLVTLFVKKEITKSERVQLLSGKAPADQCDAGRTLCSCFSVGEKTILDAIRKDKLTSVEEVGEKLLCGTNCGSCIPELKELLGQAMEL
ncbi:molybdopterin dinucleotide binding domain-containing protein, partial [Solemya elarraichensis gill symbiont]